MIKCHSYELIPLIQNEKGIEREKCGRKFLENEEGKARLREREREREAIEVNYCNTHS